MSSAQVLNPCTGFDRSRPRAARPVRALPRAPRRLHGRGVITYAPRVRTPPRRAAALLLAALLALVAGGIGVARAALRGRIYKNDDCRVAQLELPRGWEITPSGQIAYPRLLVVATAGPARIVLGVQRVLPGTDALGVATEARAVLARQGWRDPRVTPEGERVILEAALTAPPRFLRQVYLVDGDLAFVLTLVAPVDRRERTLREFEGVVRSLDIIRPALGDNGVPVETSRCR